MPDYTITVSVNDAKIIQRLAEATGRNPIEMVEQYIANWAQGQIQGFFIDKIRGKTTEELIELLGDINGVDP